MGWWKVEGTEVVVGDDVFAVTDDAAQEVVRLYRDELGRLPTRSEWEVILRDLRRSCQMQTRLRR